MKTKFISLVRMVYMASSCKIIKTSCNDSTIFGTDFLRSNGRTTVATSHTLQRTLLEMQRHMIHPAWTFFKRYNRLAVESINARASKKLPPFPIINDRHNRYKLSCLHRRSYIRKNNRDSFGILYSTQESNKRPPNRRLTFKFVTNNYCLST